jgi:hypothetical protein
MTGPTLHRAQAYMERLNAFIVSNKPALGRFYDQIVDHPERGKLSDLTVRQHNALRQGTLQLTPITGFRCRLERAMMRSSSCAPSWGPT